jgi:hypothetical protein
MTGKDLIKRKEYKAKELALFQDALKFEERYRKPRKKEMKIEFCKGRI